MRVPWGECMLGSNPPTSTGYPLDRLPLQAKPQIMDMIVAIGRGREMLHVAWAGELVEAEQEIAQYL